MKADVLITERPTTMRKDLEHRLQVRCVTWFRYQWFPYRYLLFAIPNGGQRGKASAGKLKAEGVVSGVADLFLAMPARIDDKIYHGLFIEMKSPYGYQSQKQKQWQLQIEQQNYKYSVCKQFEQFQKTVNDWMHATTRS